MEEHVEQSRTLFVRKIPHTATNECLANRFSEIGPVKRAFVIKEKGDAKKNRGFGYVTYSFRDDAVKAMETIKVFDGRDIFITFADRRNMGDSSSQRKPPPTKRVESSKYVRARTIVVSQIPKNTPIEKIEKLASSLKKVINMEYKDAETNPTALMHFKSIREAKMALRKLDNFQFRGVTLKAIQQCNDAAYMPRKVLKMRRLIVRNLSFKTTVENFKKTFEKFGEVLEAVIPSSNNRSCGFGFIQYIDIRSADRAIKEMNAKEIDGRAVAIDWAISKTKYDKYKESLQQKDSKKGDSKVPVNSKDPSSDNDGGGDDDDEDDGSDDSASVHDNGIADVKSGKKKVKSNISDDESEGDDDDDDDDEDEDDDDEDDDEEDDDDDGSDEDDDDGDEDEEDDDDESDINDSDIEDSQVEDKASKKKAQTNKQLQNKKSDINQGRTIFIRNVPFSCTEADLTDLFCKFGEITYCVLVKKDNIPRGSGFVKFVNKEDAEKCLERCSGETPKEKIVSGGRQLFVSAALSREQVDNLKTSKTENTNKDGRNLHLAREGLIRAGMKAAEGLSKSDLNKRLKAEMRRRQKLKDPGIFVSNTRLCVQNIPTNVTDKQLKEIFLKAVNDKKCVITESRIMRDMSRTNAQGVSRSLGYGFVSFQEHQHALAALRNTNNNPDIFGPNKRLIIEFSLENKKALEVKQKRLDKSKQVLSQRQKKDIFSKKDKGQQPTAGTKRDRFHGKTQKQKIMPSHLGPKNRHRDKGLPVAKTEKRIKEKRIREFQGNQKQNQKKPQKRKSFSDSFDSMVAKYKKKMLNTSS